MKAVEFLFMNFLNNIYYLPTYHFTLFLSHYSKKNFNSFTYFYELNFSQSYLKSPFKIALFINMLFITFPFVSYNPNFIVPFPFSSISFHFNCLTISRNTINTNYFTTVFISFLSIYGFGSLVFQFLGSFTFPRPTFLRSPSTVHRLPSTVHLPPECFNWVKTNVNHYHFTSSISMDHLPLSCVSLSKSN